MISKISCSLLASLVLILLAPGSVNGQISAEELLESGVYREEVEGELEDAIEIFDQIIVEHAQNRAVVAEALLHLGSSYEKLGNERAQDAYERLINEFGDQQTIVSEARMRLQRMRYRELAEGIQRNDTGPTYRIALDEDVPALEPLAARQYDLSPDGDQIVYQGKDGLYVSDASGTLRRQLVAQGDNRNDWFVIYFSVGQPRWSPDGKQIAYLAGKMRPPRDDPNDLIYTIFLIDSGGKEARQLVGRLDPAPRGGLCWTPDGLGLTYLALGEVWTLDLDGNVVGKIDLEAQHHFTRLTGYSPDGRWLAIQRKADEESGNNFDTDVHIVPTGGGNAVQLTFVSGFDGNPVWNSDSRSLYFVSARTAEPGTSNIWKVHIDGQTGRPIGDPEQVTFFNDARIMHPQVIGDGSRIAFSLDKTKHSVHVAPDGQPDKYHTLARGVSPALSPDGKTVYYVGEGPDQQGVYAVSAEGGQPKKLTAAMPVAGVYDLSPDGLTLAYFMDQDNGRGLFTLPVTGGKPQLLLEDDCDECCKAARWSPDGRWLTYTSGDGLYLIPASGGEPRKLATLRGWEAWTISWSPNGEYIAALGYQEGEENNAVYVVPVEGGAARLLSEFTDYKEGLSWHPDGQSLTYHLSKPKSQTYRTYLDGRLPELFLDKSDAWDYTGRWSPDGKRYYLKNSRDKEWYLDIYDVGTGEFTPFAENADLPRWSDDSKTMVWTTERSIHQLWLMENFK